MTLTLNAQQINWQEMAPMPEPVSNNAVTTAMVGGVPYLFSFAGIDTSKDWFGIHNKAFRYNTATNVWDTIPALADPSGGKIAAGASTVKNKIYIIGGYHVASNYSETSSDKVHIYDPETNTYLPDGAPIPVPIDDQVQAVWRDSLIYVITGWSNTTNVANVQIYNPAENGWLTGTSVPNNTNWKVFGGSGVIIGDTIYYAGGARSTGSFSAVSFFRKGYINPEDPTNISWIGNNEPQALGYRMGASVWNAKPIWIGGSDVTYNFDGIAYNGSGGVPALERITYYDPALGSLSQVSGFTPPAMDLRGIGKLGENAFLIAGGMAESQQVTDRTILVTIGGLTPVAQLKTPENFSVYPNPASHTIRLQQEGRFVLEIIDASGRRIWRKRVEGGKDIDIKSLKVGVYTLNVYQKKVIMQVGRLVVVK
ncbi:MAG: hypothetical protein DHS20C18_42250 [Saprospiraceae bacterium]|nr:MAG: hypothetical protein DHS20C18_42250 [Saprospiraceae bacterium]